MELVAAKFSNSETRKSDGGACVIEMQENGYVQHLGSVQVGSPYQQGSSYPARPRSHKGPGKIAVEGLI